MLDCWKSTSWTIHSMLQLIIEPCDFVFHSSSISLSDIIASRLQSIFIKIETLSKKALFGSSRYGTVGVLNGLFDVVA